VREVDTRQLTREAGLVAAVGAFQVYTALAGGERDNAVPLDVLGFGLLLVGPLCLPLRHRAPLLVVAIGLLAGILYFPLGYPGAAILTTAVVAIVSLWRRRLAEERQAQERERVSRASEERLAIARDLHDVLAHSLSVVQVQAGVALHLMDERPEQVRTALTAIKQASADGMHELRAAVAALRRDGEAAGPALSPLPGLHDLPRLIAGAEAAGLNVRLTRGGHGEPVPPAVSVVGFRVVQEALTNAVRHGGATRCDIRVEADSRLRVVVDDDGRAAGPVVEGNGLRGMRERVAAVGGTLQAGPLPEGGFRVHAEMPLDGR
jgi:signal transduction histidine kinase